MPETGSPIFIGFSCGDKRFPGKLIKVEINIFIRQCRKITKLILHRYLRNWHWTILRSCFSSPWGLYIFIFVEFLVIVPRVYKCFIHPSIHSAEDAVSQLIYWFLSIFNKVYTNTISQNLSILVQLGVKGNQYELI